MKPDEFKSLINQIGKLIDRRAKTTEVLIRGKITSVRDEVRSVQGEIKTSEKRIINHLHADIKASEARLGRRIDATAEELRVEILAARAEAKADNLHLSGKIDKLTKGHEKRLENLEEHTGTTNPTKN